MAHSMLFLTEIFDLNGDSEFDVDHNVPCMLSSSHWK